MKKLKLKHTLATMFAIALSTLLAMPAIAALGSKDITVYPGVNIYIDDQKLNPTDASGNPVEVFIYNGTTYLPVRAVSESLGQIVQWDGSTSSVYIGKHGGAQPSVWLGDLDYFYLNGSTTWYTGTTKDNLGNEHGHSIYPKTSFGDESYAVYKINGQYSRLTGLFYQLYNYRSEGVTASLSIYGDDELLWQGTVGPNIEPMEVDVNLTGVLELKISGVPNRGSHLGYFDYAHAAFGEAGLWT